MKLYRDGVRRLHDEIFILQLEDFLVKNERGFAKLNAKTRKDLITVFGPYAITILATLATTDLKFLVIGTAYVSLRTIAKLTKDCIADIRSISKPFDPSIIDINDQDVFGHLQRPIVTKKEEDFLRPDYKEILENANPETDFIESCFNVPTMDDVMQHVVREYDILNRAYQLPPMNISNKQWDLLFETFRKYISDDEDIDEKLYEYMSSLLRYTVADALVHNRREINIALFIDMIKFMSKTRPKQINYKAIIEELNQSLNQTKIIDLNNYPLKYGKKK